MRKKDWTLQIKLSFNVKRHHLSKEFKIAIPFLELIFKSYRHRHSQKLLIHNRNSKLNLKPSHNKKKLRKNNGSIFMMDRAGLNAKVKQRKN